MTDPKNGNRPEGKGSVLKRSDFVIGTVLAGIAWSVYSYLVAVEFFVADEGVLRSEAPDWALGVMVLVAPVAAVCGTVGIAVRRWWIRYPAVLLAAALIVLWRPGSNCSPTSRALVEVFVHCVNDR